MTKPRFRCDAGKRDVPTVLPLRGGQAHPRAAGFRGAAGQSVRLGDPDLVLVGTGAGTAGDWEDAGAAAVAALPDAPRLLIDARGVPNTLAAHLTAGALARCWRFDALFGRNGPPPAPERIDLRVDDPALAQVAWERIEPGLRGALFARDLVVEPANRLTPDAFVRRLRALEEFGLSVEVIDRKRLAAMGAGALLAVGRGAAEGPFLLVIRWPGDPALLGGEAAPVVFAGKGMCFDTGGISIKPAAGMERMRGDMAGAAACAGAMLALALRRSIAPAAAVLAIAENGTDGRAFRPSDVLRTLSGLTVEVVDTDAEGRLALADALHHAATALRPRAIVDLATLTGAVVTALGHERAGLFGNDDALAEAAMRAGDAVGEPLWPLPIAPRHRDDLRSDIADLRHCLPAGAGVGGGGRLMPDASHGAAFLREFVGAVPWLHLDIAGVAQRDAARGPHPAGPTGFGARLLDRLMADRFEVRRRAPRRGGA